MGNISVGGLVRHSFYDRYEGEIHAGFAHGLGILMNSSKSSIFLGEFNYGKMKGCGLQLNLKSYFDLVKQGFSYKSAWILSKKSIIQNSKSGTFIDNKHVKHLSYSSHYVENSTCSVYELKGVLCELKNVIAETRMFQFKPMTSYISPYSNNNLTFLDFQNPILYPFNTKFLAPGPTGQCFSIPNESFILREMTKISRNYNYIYGQYNIMK